MKKSTKVYGRSIEEWLLYKKLPLFIESRLYIITLDEVNVKPRTYWVVRGAQS